MASTIVIWFGHYALTNGTWYGKWTSILVTAHSLQLGRRRAADPPEVCRLCNGRVHWIYKFVYFIKTFKTNIKKCLHHVVCIKTFDQLNTYWTITELCSLSDSRDCSGFKMSVPKVIANYQILLPIWGNGSIISVKFIVHFSNPNLCNENMLCGTYSKLIHVLAISCKFIYCNQIQKCKKFQQEFHC